MISLQADGQTVTGPQETKCFTKFPQTAKVMKWEIQHNNFPIELQRLSQAVATAVAFIFDLIALPFRASLFLSFGLCADQVMITKKTSPKGGTPQTTVTITPSNSSDSSVDKTKQIVSVRNNNFSLILEETYRFNSTDGSSSSSDVSSYTSGSESESSSLNNSSSYSSSSSDATSSYASEWESDSSESEAPMLIPGSPKSHFKSESFEAPSSLNDDIEEELNVESTTSTYSSSDNTSSGSLDWESDSSYNYSSEFIEKLNRKLIDNPSQFNPQFIGKANTPPSRKRSVSQFGHFQRTGSTGPLTGLIKRPNAPGADHSTSLSPLLKLSPFPPLKQTPASLLADHEKKSSRAPSSPSSDDDDLSLENPSEKKAGTPALNFNKKSPELRRTSSYPSMNLSIFSQKSTPAETPGNDIAYHLTFI
jgi:hypothetical protein